MTESSTRDDGVLTVHTGYNPHPGQTRFHDDDSKFRLLSTGIGFGKSACGAVELINNMVEFPCEEDAYYLILAPTSKVLNHASLPQFFKFCPKELILRHDKGRQTIIFQNGSKLVYLTADNPRHIERLSGLTLAGAWIDEARLFHQNLWPTVVGRLRSTSGSRRVWLTTSPSGPFHALYKLFFLGVDPETEEPLDEPGQYSVITGSTHENPYLPDDYILTLEKNYKGRLARRDIHGEWLGAEGQVFDNFSHDVHVLDEKVECKDNLILVGKKKIKEVQWGIDWGFENPSVVLMVGFDNDDRAYVLREFYRSRQTVKEVSEWLGLQRDSFQSFMTMGWSDHEPDNVELLNRDGFYTLPAKKDVLPGIQTLYNRFELGGDGMPRLFILKECRNLIRELGVYRYADTQSSRGKERPVKDEDHAIDSLRYVLHSRRRKHGKHKRGLNMRFMR